MSRSSIVSELLAGPIVQTIFAFRMPLSSALDKKLRTPNDALVHAR
jgi:hypothetical protein